MATTKVQSEHIAINAISGTIIADNAITSVHIAQNAILTQHIDDGQVGTAQLAADAVTGAKLADSSVVTANIQDDQVTGDKLADNITIAGTLASTGVLTANAGVVVDNITIDGTEIDLSSGDLTLDVAGRINLDADTDGDVRFKDGGTQYGQIFHTGSDMYIRSSIDNEDMVFQGWDGGSAITALTLDMSLAGAATFNGTGAFSGSSLSVGSSSLSQAQISVRGTNSGTNPAATGHMASALVLYNEHNTDNSFSGIDFNNQGDLVDSRIVGIHKSQSSRHGEIAFLVHNGSALTERMRLDKDGNVCFAGCVLRAGLVNEMWCCGGAR